MKFKKLGFSTKEGLSLANFEDGWSMEYGKGGSYHCDLLFNNKVVAELTEYGNGGCLGINRKATNTDLKLAEAAILACLKRLNKDYGPESQYDLCKNATETGETEYASLAEMLLNEYDKRKDMAKTFKKGYKYVGIYNNPWGYTKVGGNDKLAIAMYGSKQGIEGELKYYTDDYLENKII